MFSFCGRPGGSARVRRWPTVNFVSQLSFFSAESVPPAIADLTGILAAPGKVVLVGSDGDVGARLADLPEAPIRDARALDPGGVHPGGTARARARCTAKKICSGVAGLRNVTKTR